MLAATRRPLFFPRHVGCARDSTTRLSGTARSHRLRRSLRRRRPPNPIWHMLIQTARMPHPATPITDQPAAGPRFRHQQVRERAKPWYPAGRLRGRRHIRVAHQHLQPSAVARARGQRLGRSPLRGFGKILPSRQVGRSGNLHSEIVHLVSVGPRAEFKQHTPLQTGMTLSRVSGSRDVRAFGGRGCLPSGRFHTKDSRIACGQFFSLRHVDNHGIAAQAQHQTFPFAFEMHDDPGLVLKPKVPAAHLADHETVLTLGIRTGE
jgi:hypothetical protein